jgi:hypothetical protein
VKKILYLTHGFILSVGSAIIIYVSKRDSIIYVPPSDVLPPIIFSVILFLLFVLLGYFLTHKLATAGLIASFLILGFLIFWPVFVAIVFITLLSLFLLNLIHKRVRYDDVHNSLNVISIVVVGFYIIKFVSFFAGLPWASYHATIQPIQNLPNTLPSQVNKPDIYYIILDSYGRADMLRTVHGFDNSKFVEALTKRGFAVESNSQTNYPRTLPSLSSSLNMQYLDTMSSAMGDSNLWWPVMATVQHSEVRMALHNWGYKTVFFSSGWDTTDIRDGDYYEAPYPVMLKNFDNLFLNMTNLSIFRGINWLGIGYPSYNTQRQIILNNFKTLPVVANISGPKFVFAHIIAPHFPYVFDQEGNPVTPTYSYTLSDPMNMDPQQSWQSYREQMLFVNQEILATIDGILANSKTPPIIIIQGDHGPGIFIDYNSAEKSCLYERYSILNAYYLPGVDPNSVPVDLAPVNSFRFIFNTYFQTSLELLPNREYFSTSADFYHFTDITGQTQNACQSLPVKN